MSATRLPWIPSEERIKAVATEHPFDLTQLTDDHRQLLLESSDHHCQDSVLLRKKARLEYLGDAFISAVTTEYMTVQYPELPVGQVADIRNVLVSNEVFRLFVDTYGWPAVSHPPLDPKKHPKLAANMLEIAVGGLVLKNRKEAHRWVSQALGSLAEVMVASLADSTRPNVSAPGTMADFGSCTPNSKQTSKERLGQWFKYLRTHQGPVYQRSTVYSCTVALPADLGVVSAQSTANHKDAALAAAQSACRRLARMFPACSIDEEDSETPPPKKARLS